MGKYYLYIGMQLLFFRAVFSQLYIDDDYPDEEFDYTTLPKMEPPWPKLPVPPLPDEHRKKLDALLLNNYGDPCYKELELAFFDRLSEISNGDQFDEIFKDASFTSGKLICNRFAGLECAHLWDGKAIVHQCMCRRFYIWEAKYSKCALRKYRRCLPDKRDAYYTPGHFKMEALSPYESLQDYTPHLKCLDDTYCHPVTLDCVCYKQATCPPDDDPKLRGAMDKLFEDTRSMGYRQPNFPHVASYGEPCNAKMEDFKLKGADLYSVMDWELVLQFYDRMTKKTRLLNTIGDDQVYCDFLRHMDCSIDLKRSQRILQYGRLPGDVDYASEYDYEDGNAWKAKEDALYETADDHDYYDTFYDLKKKGKIVENTEKEEATDPDEDPDLKPEPNPDLVPDSKTAPLPKNKDADLYDVEIQEAAQEVQDYDEYYSDDPVFSGDFVMDRHRLARGTCGCKVGYTQVGDECRAAHLTRCTWYIYHRNVWYQFERKCAPVLTKSSRFDLDCVKLGDIRRTDEEAATGICCEIYGGFHGGTCSREKYLNSRRYRSEFRFSPFQLGTAIVRLQINKTVNVDWHS